MAAATASRSGAPVAPGELLCLCTAPAAASNGSGSSSSAEEKTKAEVPAMVAQPLLEAHYSLHGAFLERPLLEVCVVLRPRACCQLSISPAHVNHSLIP